MPNRRGPWDLVMNENIPVEVKISEREPPSWTFVWKNHRALVQSDGFYILMTADKTVFLRAIDFPRGSAYEGIQASGHKPDDLWFWKKVPYWEADSV